MHRSGEFATETVGIFFFYVFFLILFFHFAKKLNKIMWVKRFYDDISSWNMKTKCKLNQKQYQNSVPENFSKF